MTRRQYDSATAQSHMQWAYSDYQVDQQVPYKIRDDGVYVNEVFREFCPPGTTYDWTPADCMDGPESLNPDIAPALPIPFTAADLAACMLDDIGQTICQRVGTHIGSPIEESALATDSRFATLMCGGSSAIRQFRMLRLMLAPGAEA